MVIGGVDGDDGEVEIIIAGTGNQEEMRSRRRKRELGGSTNERFPLHCRQWSTLVRGGSAKGQPERG